MAIDSAEKRKAVAGLSTQWTAVGVTPNAAKDAEWRQEVGRGYPGIAVFVIVVGPGDEVIYYFINHWHRRTQ